MGQLPHTNSFELKYYSGEAVTNSGFYPSWSGNGVAIITNIDYSADIKTAFIIPPLGGTHDSVLAFSEAPLTNVVDANNYPASLPYEVAGMDVMIQPTFMQDLTSDVTLSNSQFGLAFTTNGQLAVYHGGYNTGTEDPNAQPNVLGWTVCSNASAAATGKWIRVAVTINYNAAQGGTPVYHTMFKVTVDGVPQSSPNGLASADVLSAAGGPWFVAARYRHLDLAEAPTLRKMVLNGSGMMDDLSINPTAPSGGVTPTYMIPFGWLSSNSVTNDPSDTAMAAVEALDSDLDGMPNWAEYIAGTTPTDPNSRLAIVSEVLSNGIPRIRWLSSSTALAPYRVDESTNLVVGAGWVNVTNGIVYTAGGTNTCDMPVPTVAPTFYRVNIIQ